MKILFFQLKMTCTSLVSLDTEENSWNYKIVKYWQELQKSRAKKNWRFCAARAVQRQKDDCSMQDQILTRPSQAVCVWHAPLILHQIRPGSFLCRRSTSLHLFAVPRAKSKYFKWKKGENEGKRKSTSQWINKFAKETTEQNLFHNCITFNGYVLIVCNFWYQSNGPLCVKIELLKHLILQAVAKRSTRWLKTGILL